MSLKETLQKLACIVMYRLVEPELVNQNVETTNRRPGHVPILDSCGGANTLTTNFNGGVGRIRGQAFGCGNFFQNKNGHITADFKKTFAVSPEDLLSGETYEFRINVGNRGRMRHFPAVTPGGITGVTKQPPPITLGMIFTMIRVRQGGNTIGQLSPTQFFHYTREHTPDPVIIFNDITGIGNTTTLKVQFTPTGNSLIFFEVVTSVQAMARGDFSDIKVGGLNSIDTQFLEIRIQSPVVQKVFGDDDVCADLLGWQQLNMMNAVLLGPILQS